MTTWIGRCQAVLDIRDEGQNISSPLGDPLEAFEAQVESRMIPVTTGVLAVK